MKTLKNPEQKNVKSTVVGQFIGDYFNSISKLLTELDYGQVTQFIQLLERARENQNTVFIIGNGGSAATASHMANDLCHNSDDGFGKSVRAFSLTDNVAILTTIANDFGYEYIFVKQLESHYRPGDILIAISASGNSPNLLAAAQWVKAKRGTVASLVGFDGGKLKPLSDVLIHVKTPQGCYGPVEDVHMILDHLVYSWFKFARSENQSKII